MEFSLIGKQVCFLYIMLVSVSGTRPVLSNESKVTG